MRCLCEFKIWYFPTFVIASIHWTSCFIEPVYHTTPVYSETCIKQLPNFVVFQDCEVVFHNRENKHDIVRTLPGKWWTLCVFSKAPPVSLYRLHCIIFMECSPILKIIEAYYTGYTVLYLWNAHPSWKSLRPWPEVSQENVSLDIYWYEFEN